MPILSLNDITVIVVTFNSAHCIEGLRDAIADFEHLTIVDNGSSDDTVGKVRQHLPRAELIVNPLNRGFGAANNKALQSISTRLALLINPDCLPEPSFAENLLAAATRFPDAAIVAPHLRRRNGALELSYRWPDAAWKSSGPEASGPCCVGFASGAALLLNMAVMREVGFFDETFFLYYEDEDLCQRAFDKRLQIIVAPDVQLTHLSRGSVKGRSPLKAEYLRGYHHAQSKLIFEHKHASAGSAHRLRWTTLLLALLTIVPRLLLPQPKYLARLFGRIAGLCKAYPHPASAKSG
jgi:GT2 family glycosyltransferase